MTHKMRGTFFGLLNIGAHKDYMNPLTSVKLYNAIVIPKALFGAELWNVLTVAQVKKLEVLHRFCIKRMQGFHRRTRSDVACGMLGCLSIESIIDKRKLIFLGSLCRLSANFTAKSVFLFSLYRHVLFPRPNSIGFVPDLLRILEKYNLGKFVKTFLEEKIFPPKIVWKSVVNEAVSNVELRDWIMRVSADASLTCYRSLLGNLEPSITWLLAREYPAYSKLCYFVSILWTTLGISERQVCCWCEQEVNDIISHHVSHCIASEPIRIRDEFWTFVSNNYGVRVYQILDNLDIDSKLLLVLLGRLTNELVNILDTEADNFVLMCYIFLRKLCYNQRFQFLY